LALAMLASFDSVHAMEFRGLHSFDGGNDGAMPYAGLIRDEAGNLYGTTVSGGSSGYGTIFELTPKGEETVLYSFAGYPGDGTFPYAGLVAGKNGNLYGTTWQGGRNCEGGCGTIYRLKQNSTEKVIYSFAGEPDGANPSYGTIIEKNGDLYGTTESGGNAGFGTIFKASKAGAESLLYSFCQLETCADGAQPSANLVADNRGNFYGTTLSGGAANWGTVFKFTRDGKELVLHSFCSQAQCPDGTQPGGLSRDSQGNLYGTTYTGGGNGCYNGTGCGIAFKLTPNGTLTVLHAFAGGTDGANPATALIMDSQ
jgi:uncharacterized repeat protein (TIGR03803 family)